MKFTSLILFFLMLSTLSCTQPYRVRDDISKTVTANKTAKGHLAWEGSLSHPSRVFSNWLLTGTPSPEVCEALKERSNAELTIFESEIKNDTFNPVVGECKVELVEKIDTYWETHQKIADSIVMDFQFPEDVQLRDTSGGYYAWKGDVQNKEVVLTFDDGPSGDYTEKILEILRKASAKAMFFHMGRNVYTRPDIVKKVAAEGHSIGSHTMTHQCLAQTELCGQKNAEVKVGGRVLTPAESLQEIMGGHKALLDVLGWADPFFRFPYGYSTPELKKFLTFNSIAEFNWSIDSNDWKEQHPQDLVDGTMAQVNSAGRGIILLHDVQHRTAVALPLLLRTLYEQGYSIVLLKPKDETIRTKPLLLPPEPPPPPPEPTPAPAPEPSPAPEPNPNPEPVPTPEVPPVPNPEPTTNPEPVPEPKPEPAPQPTPETPIPSPEPSNPAPVPPPPTNGNNPPPPPPKIIRK
ncbi:MAG: polysaccharide deacetylase family protein [Bdellovibrionota bacterium]